MKKAQISPIFQNAILFWIVKIIIVAAVYLAFIKPHLAELDPAMANFINIAYAFLALFIIFALKGMSVGNLFSFRK